MLCIVFKSSTYCGICQHSNPFVKNPAKIMLKSNFASQITHLLVLICSSKELQHFSWSIFIHSLSLITMYGPKICAEVLSVVLWMGAFYMHVWDKRLSYLNSSYATDKICLHILQKSLKVFKSMMSFKGSVLNFLMESSVRRYHTKVCI